MTTAAAAESLLLDGRAADPVERLLEDSWQARSRRAGRRELLVDGSAAALFLAVAVPAAAAGLRGGHTHLGLAALLVVLYAVVSRTVTFPIGAGYMVPSYLVLVPMLLLLPPLLVPLLAAAGLTLGTVGRLVTKRARPQELVLGIPDAWYALGPAAVLALGSGEHGAAQTAVYVAAFLAGCLVDLLASTVRESLILGIGPRLQGRVVASVWIVDACFAPLGLAVADAARHNPLALFLLAPLNALLVLADRDRTARIAEAQHRLDVLDRQRSRLQSAVHRLGDAFAAKLDLSALFDVLVKGSIEAVDAAGGQLAVSSGSLLLGTSVYGNRRLAGLLEFVGAQAAERAEACQHAEGGIWALAIPFALGPDGRGALTVARPGLEFTEDERQLLVGLVARAESAAGEIIAHEQLREQAQTDPLTGLGNRRKLAAELGARLARGDAAEPSVVMLFDLDGFKAYNDTFGHLAGDALLARLGHKLAASVEPHGAAFRLGGDEFCVLLPADGGLQREATAAAAALEERSESFTISASCGTVLLPHEANTPDYALQLADKRMYGHKHGRRASAGDQAHDVLIHIIRAKQQGLQDHSSWVAQHAVAVGKRLGMNAEQLDELARAAALHDIGKVGIPDAILEKRGPLEPEEWDFVRQHTVLGDRILSAAPALRPVARIVRASHERWDGAGYPDGLRGEEIPLASRVVAVCDAYDAIVTDRCYRPGRSSEAARRELQECAGAQFDPVVVAAFLEELGDAASEARVADHVQPPASQIGQSVRIAELVGQIHQLLEQPS